MSDGHKRATRRQSKAQILTVYVGEQDTWHGKPLYAVLVTRLKESGIAGVTVLRGVEGYGAHHKIHTARIEVLFQGLPVLVEAVDLPERITAAMAIVDEIVTEGLATITDVTAITYSKD
jgi:PII-like signaling protein